MSGTYLYLGKVSKVNTGKVGMDERSSENWEDALSTCPLYLSNKLSSVNCLSPSLSHISHSDDCPSSLDL